MDKKKERIDKRMRKAVFFDLDGTLLPMDNDEFIHGYFGTIQKSGVTAILHRERGMDMFFASVRHMMGEHGQSSNEEAFARRLEELSGVQREAFLPAFEAFYRTHFKNVRQVVKKEPVIHEILRVLKDKNYTLVLATSPVFPQIATDMRMEWAGLDKADFMHVTCYENSRYVKPNLKYYEDVLRDTGFDADECYMVGNSVTEDLCALKLGFEVFFVTNYHVGNMAEAPECPRGTYNDLLRWALNLPRLKKEAV